MGLVDFAPKGGWSIEAEIRLILEAQGEDSSTVSCRAWARAFICTRVKNWQPGRELDWYEAAAVGEAFEKVLWKVARRRLPKPKHPRDYKWKRRRDH